MRKVILYIAQSVDGYIADAKGQVAWLKGQVADLELPDTYTSFIQNVDTIIMGKRHIIRSQLNWPKICDLIQSNKVISSPIDQKPRPTS